MKSIQTKTALFCFMLLGTIVVAQLPSAEILAAPTKHRCCSKGYSSTDSDGMYQYTSVTRCVQVQGNAQGASEAAYESACANAERDAAIIRNIMG